MFKLLSKFVCYKFKQKPLFSFIYFSLLFSFYLPLAFAQSNNSFLVKGAGKILTNGQTEVSLFDFTDISSRDVNFGAASVPFEIVNNSSEALIFGSNQNVTLTGDLADFRVSIDLPRTVPAFSSRFFTIEFNPFSSGIKSVTASISSNNSFFQGHSFRIQGEGSGIPNLGVFYVSGEFQVNKHLKRSADLVYFGELPIGDMPITKNFHITNLGPGSLRLTGTPLIQVAGFASDDFKITKFPKAVLEEGEEDFLTLAFSPKATGQRDVSVFLQRGLTEQYFFIASGRGTEAVVLPDIDSDSNSDDNSDDNFASNPNPDSDTEVEEDEEIEVDNTNLDSDGDGVSDAQEIIDASDPKDPVSFLPRLNKEFCFDWNGFLGMSYNIAEFSNLTSNSIEISSKLFETAGSVRDTQLTSILPGSQSDLLVHDMDGWSRDRIGTVCASASSSGNDVQAGDIQGRTLRYKPSADGGFDFVLGNEFANPVSGSQFAQFNHFNPSYDPKEAGFFVANWFSVRNFESSQQEGQVIVYDIDGTVLRVVPIQLSANGWYDFGSHIIGANKLGIVEWRPNSDTALFRTNISRYYYGDTFGASTDNITEAVALPGLQGTSKLLVSPVDTRGQSSVIEISNTHSVNANVTVLVNDKSGNNVLNTVINLAPKSTSHFVLDDILKNELGLASVKSRDNQEIIVNVLQYRRDESLGIKNIYTVTGRESLGSELVGTYNTFLSQQCFLTLVNSKTNQEEVKLSLVKYNGQNLVNQKNLVVPARGALEVNACQYDTANSYGTVKIETSRAGAVVANMLRVGANEDYRIATPVK